MLARLTILFGAGVLARASRISTDVLDSSEDALQTEVDQVAAVREELERERAANEQLRRENGALRLHTQLGRLKKRRGSATAEYKSFDESVVAKGGGGSGGPPIGIGFPGMGGSGSSKDDQASVLAAHNKWRCMHGASALVWDSELAGFAASWAKQTSMMNPGHSPGSSRQSSRYGGTGENIAYGVTGTAAVKAWYDEVKSCPNNGACSGFGMSTGHYTQVVWKGTSAVGCAKQGSVFVCNYGPAGNVMGAFAQNVASKSKSESQCGSSRSRSLIKGKKSR